MKAMILAAGRGTRLGEIGLKVPKALVDIDGKSILRLAVEKCTASGFDDIIINVHHLAGLVRREIAGLKRDGFSLSVSDESDQLLETGGGLFKARHFFDNNPFLLYNVDIISDIDLNELYSFHLENGPVATLAVREREGNRFFLVNRAGDLRGWFNKSTGERIITGHDNETVSPIAFAGIHVIEPSLFKSMNNGIYTMTDLYLRVASSCRISTFRYDSGYWFDVGTPDNLEKARKMFRG